MTLDELSARALFAVNDPCYWQGSACRVTSRYWRASSDLFLYDLIEVVPDGLVARRFYKVPERQLDKPSHHTLGIDQRLQR